MVGWEINYESAFFYLFPKGKQSKVFKYAIRILWLVPGFLALGKTPQVIWTIVDIVSGFWCIPNAIALLALSGLVVKISRENWEEEDEKSAEEQFVPVQSAGME